MWIALCPESKFPQLYHKDIVQKNRAISVIADLALKDLLFREESKELMIWESGCSHLLNIPQYRQTRFSNATIVYFLFTNI